MSFGVHWAVIKWLNWKKKFQNMRVESHDKQGNWIKENRGKFDDSLAWFLPLTQSSYTPRYVVYNPERRRKGKYVKNIEWNLMFFEERTKKNKGEKWEKKIKLWQKNTRNSLEQTDSRFFAFSLFFPFALIMVFWPWWVALSVFWLNNVSNKMGNYSI